jgi:hypothetical protein
VKEQLRLDSQKSYTELVNSDIIKGRVLKGDVPLSEDYAFNNPVPVTATVISNMRGRSIMSGSKDLLIAVNGQG